MSDSEDSDIGLLVQALPVSDFDLNDPPSYEKALTSPDEYLKFVRYQALLFPSVLCRYPPTGMVDQVTTSQVDCSKSNDQVGQKNDEIIPTKIPRRLQENQVIHFHRVVDEYKCLKTLVLRNSDDITKTDIPITKITLLEQAPSLTWIAQRSRSEIITLIGLAASVCTKKHWNSKLSVWIFSLLVALEPPFHPDLCYDLRTIAKRCQKLRRNFERLSLLTTTSNGVKHCSVVAEDIEFFSLCINLISNVFGQSDLADELTD
ncbi:hypothetical protein EWB00_010546 [Schistosoma japonicum]|uniref:Gem-associated protein 2 n=1 Tax=Schistosoma japonicum TaxID=6182 RepID=A0A4Z2DPU9_SCHJA|nr:hypothetical protein KSF78_0006282 [Schistosoma japonicum]TNN18190.1 hypothetical protein EWB00_010546 [Schistosoma japonicum]TNN18191.1 hypothetical protein EWB00_010546 [Schistosoma japonicum]